MHVDMINCIVYLNLQSWYFRVLLPINAILICLYGLPAMWIRSLSVRQRCLLIIFLKFLSLYSPRIHWSSRCYVLDGARRELAESVFKKSAYCQCSFSKNPVRDRVSRGEKEVTQIFPSLLERFGAKALILWLLDWTNTSEAVHKNGARRKP